MTSLTSLSGLIPIAFHLIMTSDLAIRWGSEEVRPPFFLTVFRLSNGIVQSIALKNILPKSVEALTFGEQRDAKPDLLTS